MNEFSYFYDDYLLFDLVIMNEDPHFHSAMLELDDDLQQSMNVMIQPKVKIKKIRKDRDLEVILFCPQCKKVYSEASRRLRKHIIKQINYNRDVT